MGASSCTCGLGYLQWDPNNNTCPCDTTKAVIVAGTCSKWCLGRELPHHPVAVLALMRSEGEGGTWNGTTAASSWVVFNNPGIPKQPHALFTPLVTVQGRLPWSVHTVLALPRVHHCPLSLYILTSLPPLSPPPSPLPCNRAMQQVCHPPGRQPMRVQPQTPGGRLHMQGLQHTGALN